MTKEQLLEEYKEMLREMNPYLTDEEINNLDIEDPFFIDWCLNQAFLV